MSPGLESAPRDLPCVGLQPHRYLLPSPSSRVYGEAVCRAGTGHPRSCCPASLPASQAASWQLCIPRRPSAAFPHQTPLLQPLFSNWDKMLGAAPTRTGPAGTVQWHTPARRGKRPLLPAEPAMLPALGEKLAPLPGAWGPGRASCLGCIMSNHREKQSLSIRSSGRAFGCRAQPLGARHGLAAGYTLAREGSCAGGQWEWGARSDPKAGKLSMGHDAPRQR